MGALFPLHQVSQTGHLGGRWCPLLTTGLDSQWCRALVFPGGRSAKTAVTRDRRPEPPPGRRLQVQVATRMAVFLPNPRPLGPTSGRESLRWAERGVVLAAPWCPWTSCPAALPVPSSAERGRRCLLWSEGKVQRAACGVLPDVDAWGPGEPFSSVPLWVRPRASAV